MGAGVLERAEDGDGDGGASVVTGVEAALSRGIENAAGK